MQKGDFITITYTGKLKEGGHTFEKAEKVPVVLGAGFIITGLEHALEQMKVGEKKTVEVEPEKGFGERTQELVKVVPETEMKRHNVQPQVGMPVEADGRRGRVVSVTNGRVTIDFNHPLAGKALVYDVEIIGKIEGREQKISALVKGFSSLEPTSVTITGDMVEIILPPLLHPVVKKRLADEIRKYTNLNRVKFSEIFEKPKAEVDKADHGA
ncbi:MAG: peptidylprolyl isomerase [Candidatus Aenigmatarchaeota archaeon]